jgi:hypothetical protein
MKLFLGVVSIIVMISLVAGTDPTIGLSNDISEKLFKIAPAYTSPTPANSIAYRRLFPVSRRRGGGGGGGGGGGIFGSTSTPMVQGGAISLLLAMGVTFLLMF